MSAANGLPPPRGQDRGCPSAWTAYGWLRAAGVRGSQWAAFARSACRGCLWATFFFVSSALVDIICRRWLPMGNLGRAHKATQAANGLPATGRGQPMGRGEQVSFGWTCSLPLALLPLSLAAPSWRFGWTCSHSRGGGAHRCPSLTAAGAYRYLSHLLRWKPWPVT